MEFKALEEKLKLGWLNQAADENISVEYSEDDGLIYVESKEIRPSEILYRFDRENYVKKLEQTRAEAREAILDPLIDRITNVLTEHVFNGFEPYAYGWDFPEVYIDDSQFDGDWITVSGSISTSVRLGASSEEDGSDIDYSSVFSATFSFEDGYNLEEINIEKTDWIEHSSDDEEPDFAPEPDDREAPEF